MGKEELSELQLIWDEARQNIESGNPDKAIEIYKYILVRYSDDAVAVEYANAYLADLYLTLQKYDLTESHIQKALKNKPENGEYLRGLGWAKYSSGNVAEGLANLERASRLAPNNANILTDLAVVSLSLPDVNRAREYAEKAVRMDSGNKVARDVLHNTLVFGKRLSRPEKEPAIRKVRPSSYADTHFIHRFKVSLKNNPDVWRVIDIKENQMLSSLHKAIFNAFDRIEEHEYSFF